MTFIHEDPEFPALVDIVGSRQQLDVGLVEKDYWVTHTLWSLHEQGLEVWFKGGTSLSKGFGLIRRFSEDLDLKIAPGTTGLPSAQNWKSEGSKATTARREFFDAFVEQFRVSGAVVARDPDDADPSGATCACGFATREPRRRFMPGGCDRSSFSKLETHA